MAKKIDVEKFVKWINEMIIDEMREIERCMDQGKYEKIYGHRESINTYKFILERIGAREEEWLDESES